jgi:hypothetical protein
MRCCQAIRIKDLSRCRSVSSKFVAIPSCSYLFGKGGSGETYEGCCKRKKTAHRVCEKTPVKNASLT